MKFVTWNVHRGKDNRGVSNESAVIINTSLLEPDFLALQEVPSEGWLHLVANSVPTPLYSYFMSTHQDGSGVGIITPHLCNIREYPFAPRCWGGSPSLRGVMTATPISGPRLTVMCTHFSADFKLMAQSRQATQLANLVDGTDGDVVVMGDLNAHNATPALKKLYATGLEDMWLSSLCREKGYRRGCTFPTRFPFQRIDYVLARADHITCTSAYAFDVGGASDHKCLVTNISGTQ